MHLRLKSVLITLLTLCFTCHSYAWESNSWGTYVLRDDVFDEINLMYAAVMGLDSKNKNVRFEVACQPAAAMLSSTMTADHGPLVTKLTVTYDTWLGRTDGYVKYLGRYQIDSKRTQTIKSLRDTIFSFKFEKNQIVYFHTKDHDIYPELLHPVNTVDTTFIRELMAGSTFILKPFENAIVKGFSDDNEIDLHKWLDKDEVMKFSLKGSASHIQNVVDYCGPHISKWHEAQRSTRKKK